MSSLAESTALAVPTAGPLALPTPPKLIRYSQIVKQPLEWLWPQRIALGKLTFLVGEPGLGKGLLAVDLAARVSRGSPWPAAAAQHAPLGTAILLHAEDDHYDTMPGRLQSAGADLERVVTFEMESARPDSRVARTFSLRDDLGALEAALSATSDCRLVVIDPISAYLGEADANQNRQVRLLLHPLAELARIYRVAIVAVAHLNKRSSASSVNRVMGALSFVAAARTVWGVARDPSNAEGRLMLALKNNLSAENQGLRFRLPKPDGALAPRVEWDTQSVALSFSGAAGNQRFNLAEREYGDTENHTAVRLREELEGGPRSRQDLDLCVGGSEQQLYRAADRLGVVKIKEGWAGGWLWMLPEHFPKWREEHDQQQRRAKLEHQRRRRGNLKAQRSAKRRAKQTGRRRAKQTGRRRAKQTHDDLAQLSPAWREVLRQSYPGVPLKKAAWLGRQRLEKSVREGMAAAAERKRQRAARKSVEAVT